MERITVSLPEELVEHLKRAAKESGLKVSKIVAKALEEHLGATPPLLPRPKVRPTALWKLKGRQYLRGPSPTLRRTRVGSWRAVELDRLPL